MVVHAIVDELGTAVDFYTRPELAAGALSALKEGDASAGDWTLRSLPAGAPGSECSERVYTVVDDLDRLESAHADYESAEARRAGRDAGARAAGAAPSGRRVRSHLLIARLPNQPETAAAEEPLHRAG